MPLILAWLDSSEHERRRALDVIDLFSQTETVDELGLGTVRDTIADVLSPGTSTIQTRGRYFFFIAWVYQQLEKRGARRGAADMARRHEIALIEALSQSEDKQGVIGIDSGAKLRRLPSEIYWAGLGRLGFRLFEGSRSAYHRAVDRGFGDLVRGDANDTGHGSFRGNWHPHLPPPPTDFPSGATLALTHPEAEFFREQIRFHAQGSLLAFLAEREENVEAIGLPWEHPEVDEMNAELRQWVHDARCYSEAMSGAQLLYNFLLAEKKQMDSHRAQYSELIDAWRDRVDAHRATLVAWDRRSFWDRLRLKNARLPRGVWRFSEDWIALVLDRRPLVSTEDPEARRLIATRERDLKGSRARLFSQVHLDLWRGASSPEPLNYRWWVTRRLVDDIVAGLSSKA